MCKYSVLAAELKMNCLVVSLRYVLIVIIGCLVQFTANGQMFKAKVIGGINASQLEGDNFSGFNKIGLQGGVGVTYPLTERFSSQSSRVGKSLSIELLLNQKGSSSTFSISSNVQRTSTSLHYIQVPLLFAIDQWYDEAESHYKISLEGGLYYARLFEVKSSQDAFENFIDRFRKNDAGVVIGAKYRFRYNWSIGARYDHSFLKVFQDPNTGLRGLLSYLISLRVEYHF